MPAKSNTRRFKAAAVAAAVAAGGLIGVATTGSASADPVSLTLQYQCPFPLIGQQTLSVEINTDMPSAIAVGEPTGAFVIDTVSTVPETATQGLNLVGATTLEGSGVASSEVDTPEATLPVSVPVELEKTDVPASGSFTINAGGETPSLTFSQPGTATITVNDLLLTLTPRNAAGEETGLGTFESACTLVPGQDNVLHSFEITPASGGDEGGTDVGGDEGGTDEGGTDVGGDEGGTDEGGTDVGGDEGGTDEGGSDVGGGSDPIEIGFGLSGSSHIKAANGDVALDGTIDADFDLASGSYEADMTLADTSGEFTVFGFLPATADIRFNPTEKVTGTLSNDGKLTANATTEVILPSVKVFGLPVGGGESCRTVDAAEIPLESEGRFDPFDGGTLTGTYTLPQLSGCGMLNGIISAVTAGPGNTIELNLASRES
ncbi:MULTISPECIES: DUF6801 domain-containing protein [Streptomyces]|uniref:DUF6801 domain-containing protein n=1 Tax=Streptomyces TaxID=1883 RepID=UPI002248A9D6|nr:DUF6801 domain-containing protein [Streptomyces sp. JHD 1]MCX2968345.1 hypothetical protein [Streptomyces sp. JHD 1]